MILQRNNRHQIIVSGFIQRCGIQSCSRCNYTDNFSLNKTFCFLRVFHLLTDCHFVAFLDQSFDICLGCMKWNSAHRSTFFQSAVLTGKRQFQFFGYKDCIIKKHLIKVAQAEKQNTVRVELLHSDVLLHHGGGFCRHRGHLLSSLSTQSAPQTGTTCWRR